MQCHIEVKFTTYWVWFYSWCDYWRHSVYIIIRRHVGGIQRQLCTIVNLRRPIYLLAVVCGIIQQSKSSEWASRV